MKQTAVEFYSQEEIKLTLDFLENKITQLEYGINKLRLVEQAKEMEKEQIFDALEVSKIERLTWGISKEQYYKETFKSE